MECGLSEILFGCPIQDGFEAGTYAVDATLATAVLITKIVMAAIVIIAGIWALTKDNVQGGALAVVFMVAVLGSLGLAIAVAIGILGVYLLTRGDMVNGGVALGAAILFFFLTGGY